MKYVTLCLHHCKENFPNKREVGREQDYMKHQEQILSPSKPSIWLDQGRHMEDYLYPWITVSDDKFNLANFFYTLLFSISFPCFCLFHTFYKSPFCRKEMKNIGVYYERSMWNSFHLYIIF